MSYYDQKKRFYGDIQTLVEDNSGKTIELSALEYKFGLKYGFSRAAILKTLKVYSDMGKIEVQDDVVRIK